MKNTLVAAISSVIGLLLLSFACWTLLNGNAGKSWPVNLIMVISGIYFAVSGFKFLRTYSGVSVFKDNFPLTFSQPQTITIESPSTLKSGKIFVSFTNAIKSYSGEIHLFVKDGETECELGHRLLYSSKPIFGLPIPLWFKWLRVAEAGKVIDFWAKGSNPGFEDLIIPFERMIKKGQFLVLKVNVRNAHSKNDDGASAPLNISDAVTVVLKSPSIVL